MTLFLISFLFNIRKVSEICNSADAKFLKFFKIIYIFEFTTSKLVFIPGFINPDIINDT